MFKMRKALAVATLATMATFLLAPAVAMATPADTAAQAVATATPTQAVAGDNEWSMKKWIGLAVGLGMGIAAFGGALGQGRAAAAALDGIARNPGASGKIFTPMILGLALIELLTSGMAQDSALRLHLIENAAHTRLATMGVVLLMVLRFSPRGLIPERNK